MGRDGGSGGAMQQVAAEQGVELRVGRTERTQACGRIDPRVGVGVEAHGVARAQRRAMDRRHFDGGRQAAHPAFAATRKRGFGTTLGPSALATTRPAKPSRAIVP